MTEDTFPYKRYSMPDTPKVYFQRAQKYIPQTEERVLRDERDEDRLLRPDSVVSRTSRREFLEHFPLEYIFPKRHPPRVLIIRSPRGAYDLINVFPDYYTEDARVRDTGAYEKVSPYEYWNMHQEEIEKEAGSDPEKGIRNVHEEREILWKKGPKEARQGKITNYLTLFAILKSRIVLDPSAAWGDRLIAALASSTVQAYTGVDPHSRLPRGWGEILRDLGPLAGKLDYHRRFIMLNEPFEPEDATPLSEGMGNYDTVLISTAPLVGDQYDAGNPLQAVARHGSSLQDYVRGFLIPYLERAIAALKIGGYLCMTVLDRARDGYHITELQLLLTELLADNVMRYRGVIWWEGDSGGLVPWWIFIKEKENITPERITEARRLYEPYEKLVRIL